MGKIEMVLLENVGEGRINLQVHSVGYLHITQGKDQRATDKDLAAQETSQPLI
jgi:hypothetical protein